MGCLSAPFKVLGCLGLIVLLVIGWLYRDRVVREGRQLLGRLEGSGATAGAQTARGRPGPEGSATVRSITPSAISAARWKRAVLGWMPTCRAISGAPSGAGDR
jgi:hypothetical protein